MMPCASKPVRSASIICLAASSASAAGSSWASNASRVNASMAATVTRRGSGIRALRRDRARCYRKVFFEPVVDHAAHPRVALGEHEVIGLSKQMQIARLAGALEHLDRLLGRRHGIDRRMQQQDRAPLGVADDVVSTEVIHALRG